ncbi:MAG: GFA family protein [Planctomycetota bacterium]|nr:GFA family protein [Planctomycetota bacterium]
MNIEHLTGGCFCGGVQFQVEKPLEFISHCHCESCRLSHSAAFVTWTSVPTDQFQFVTGSDLTQRYQSESGAQWGFCRRCGSSMLYEIESAPGRIYISLASLEGSFDLAPESHVSFEEQVPWFHAGDSLPKYKGKSREPINE